MRHFKLFWLFIIMVTTFTSLEASLKHSLKCNMLRSFNETPSSTETFIGLFTQGVYYSRLRANNFHFTWKDEDASKKNHSIGAVGGSFTYKSAYLNGFGFGLGGYISGADGTLNNADALYYKAGKGVVSRYDMLRDKASYIGVLAEGYLVYKNDKTQVKVGRQIFESFLTASNDTKMIPNTFEGMTFETAILPKTSVKMAYLTKQKLRDHSGFHHLLRFGDDPTDPYASYSQNDDAAMHKGLTASGLDERGIDDRLIVLEVKNRSVENLSIKMNYTAVPKLISSAMLQMNYRLTIGNDTGWSVIPAFRVMRQFDNGAGEIAGANIQRDTRGYKDADNLDTSMYGARIDVVKDRFKLRIAHTSVTDEGDIIAPWRGFPTAGFTRAMGQYNWMANTQSTMLQVDYKFQDISEFKMISRFVLQDFDENKEGVQADSNVFTLDFLKRLGNESNIYIKTRYAHVTGNAKVRSNASVLKKNPYYDEFRLEINYLF